MKKKLERKSPPENWQEFKIYLSEILKLASKIIYDHNVFIRANGNFKSQYPLEKIKETLDEMIKFENNLSAYMCEFGENAGWVSLKVNMIFYLIQMNKVLQSRYSFLAITNMTSNYKAKNFLNESLCYVNEAIKYRDKYTNLFSYTFEKKLELDKEEVEAALVKYLPIKNPNEIDALLLNARSDKDFNRAYETFQKAYELASNDSAKQFSIALEQADYFYLKNKLLSVSFEKLTQAQITHYDDCIEKSAKPLRVASILITLNKIEINESTFSQCKAVTSKLYTASKNLYELSKSTKNSDLQISLLKHANTNITWSIKLAKKIKFEAKFIPTSSLNLQNDIAADLKILEVAKEKQLKELCEKNIQAAEMQKCIAEYEEKFSELLKKYEAPKKIDKQITKVNQPTSEISSASSSSSSESENENTKPSVTSFTNFNLNFNIQLLEDAKKQKDLAQQIYISTCIGEHLQIKAGRYLKKKEYDWTIENLKLAIEYFAQAFQLLPNTKSNEDTETTQKEFWLRNLLQTTNDILTKVLSVQRNIKQRFEYSRSQAMKYIIDKYGPEAWFKPHEVGSTRSKNAQILHDTNQKIILLEKMQEEFLQNFQIQSTEPAKTASNIVKYSAIYSQAARIEKAPATGLAPINH